MRNYFTNKEISCKCCGVVKCDEDFLILLNQTRASAGIPFIINSWYRCLKHNTEIGSKPTSSHIKGCAADIKCKDSVSRSKIISALITSGFTRMGIAKNFIHVDNDKEKPEGVIWLY